MAFRCCGNQAWWSRGLDKTLTVQRFSRTPPGAVCIPHVLAPAFHHLYSVIPAEETRPWECLYSASEERASWTLRKAGFFVYSQDLFVTGLHSANCSQRKTACLNKFSSHWPLPIWTCFRNGRRIPEQIGGPRSPGAGALQLCPPSLPCLPRSVCPCTTPGPWWGWLYIPLPQSRKCKFLWWRLRPVTKDLKPCSVCSERCIPQI